MDKLRAFSYAQRGNILFLILLAIILLVALSLAITSQRDGGKSVSDEKAQSLAAQTLQYLTLVENTVNRMILTGVAVENLDFRDPNGTSQVQTGTNTGCASPSCQVFNKNGGGLNAMALSPQAADTTRNASNFNAEGGARGDVLLVSIKGVGTTLSDIAFFYRAVDPNVCRQINIVMGINTATDALPVDGLGVNNSGGGASDFSAYEGAMNPIPVLTADVLGDYDPRLIGKRTLCVYRSASNGYYLYHVLVAR